MMRTMVPALAATVSLAGCGAFEVSEAPDFALRCAAPQGQGACGTVQCRLTPIDGFRGTIELDAAVGAGLSAYGVRPVSVEDDAPIDFMIGVSAQPTLGATAQVELTATSGDITHGLTLDVTLRSVPPPGQGANMVLFGCAGLAGIVVGPAPLDAVYVGAWSTGFTVDFCQQVLSRNDGAYQITVPESCGFTPAEAVYMTAGGVETCTIPFQAGAVQHMDVVVTATCD